MVRAPRFLRKDRAPRPLKPALFHGRSDIARPRSRRPIPGARGVGSVAGMADAFWPAHAFAHIGGRSPGKYTDEELAATEDPFERARLQYGDHESYAPFAICDAHPLVSGAWVHRNEVKRAVIVEIWWHRPPTAEERTESARAAAGAVKPWLAGNGEGWTIRVRAGREKPAKGRLGKLCP